MQIVIHNKLFLREVKLSDAEDIFEMIDLNREHLGKYLHFVSYTRKVEDTITFLKDILSQDQETKNYVFMMVYEHKPAGLIGFRDTDYVNRKTEIGYWLIKEMEGKGIVTQSCKALLNFAFQSMIMNRVVIRFATHNRRSGKIPKSLGFTFEGTERQGEKVQNNFFDLHVYSLLQSEWNEKK